MPIKNKEHIQNEIYNNNDNIFLLKQKNLNNDINDNTIDFINHTN